MTSAGIGEGSVYGSKTGEETASHDVSNATSNNYGKKSCIIHIWFSKKYSAIEQNENAAG